MKKVLLTGLVLLLLFTGCGKKEEGTSNPDGTDKSDSELFKQEYESLNNENIKITIDTSVSIRYLDAKELNEFFTSGTGLFYMGNPSDAISRLVLPQLLAKAKENKTEVVYYNSSKFNEMDESSMKFFAEKIDPYLVNEEGGKRLIFPQVYAVKDGNIIKAFYKDIVMDENSLPEMTEELKNEFLTKYQEVIDALS